MQFLATAGFSKFVVLCKAREGRTTSFKISLTPQNWTKLKGPHGSSGPKNCQKMHFLRHHFWKVQVFFSWFAEFFLRKVGVSAVTATYTSCTGQIPWDSDTKITIFKNSSLLCPGRYCGLVWERELRSSIFHHDGFCLLIDIMKSTCKKKKKKAFLFAGKLTWLDRASRLAESGVCRLLHAIVGAVRRHNAQTLTTSY